MSDGMTLVCLDRRTDREKPCCENLATIAPGKGPHAAELRCSVCDRHRGWLPQQALDFISSVAEEFGKTAEPIVLAELTDNSIGGKPMTTKKFDDNNSGVLFRNEDKKSPKHADYSGSLNAAGLDYWLDGYIRQSANGRKFFSLKLKLKPEQTIKVKEPVDSFNDEITF